MPRRRVIRRHRRTRKTSQFAVAKKAVQSVLRKQLELKKFTFAWGISVGNTPLNYNPIAINLFDYINQGLESDDRVGDRIRAMRLSLRINSESGDTPFNQMRYCIVETRETLPLDTAGTYYSAISIFDKMATLGLNSFFDYDIVKKVYMDKLVTLNQLVTGAPVVKFMRKTLNFGKNGKPVVYNGALTGTLGEANQTNLYFVAVSDSNLVPHPRTNTVWKVSYTDA